MGATRVVIWSGTARDEESSKKDAQARPNPIVAAKPPKRNRFYALKGREEQEKSVAVITGTLHVFSFPVYALLDP